jgi:hypothetical protein
MSQFARKVEDLQEASQENFLHGLLQGTARDTRFAQQRLPLVPIEPIEAIPARKAKSKPAATRKPTSDGDAAERRSQLREARESIIAKLRQMSPLARLQFIADDTHAIEFYPAEFGDVPEEVLRSLSDATRSLLLVKANRLRKGQWKALARRLARL